MVYPWRRPTLRHSRVGEGGCFENSRTSPPHISSLVAPWDLFPIRTPPRKQLPHFFMEAVPLFTSKLLQKIFRRLVPICACEGSPLQRRLISPIRNDIDCVSLSVRPAGRNDGIAHYVALMRRASMIAASTNRRCEFEEGVSAFGAYSCTNSSMR